MGKGKNPKKRTVKVVDYRSVNLAWLIAFKDRVFNKELAPGIELVVAREDVGIGSQFEIYEGDTLCVTGETAAAYTVSRPYGDVRTGEVAKSTVSPKPREEWGTEDVAEYVIKHACMEDQCTYLELIEKPKKNVSKKEYRGTFVSQARRCRFADLVGALEYFYTLKKTKISKQFVWLDIFSANQPKLTARNVEPAVRKENERQLTEGLHIAIANFEQRVMFMDKWDGATPLTRAWCVWEIFGVAKAMMPLEIALPESEYDRFIVTLKNDYDSIITKTAAVDVKKAKCFNPADLKAIHKAIRTESSFQMLDDIIKTQLRLWVASTGKLQVEKEEQKANPDWKEIRLLANQAGRTYQAQGDFGNAEPLLRKALRVAEEISEDRERDGTVALQLNNVAELLRAQGKLDDAKPLNEEALAILKKVHGEEHPLVATGLHNLAQLLKTQGKLDEAKSLYEEALAIWKKVYGEEHPLVATCLNNLAELLRAQGKYEAAKLLYEEAIAIWKKVHGDEHPLVATGLNNLAGLLRAQGKLDEALELRKECLQIEEKTLGKEHPQYAASLNNLAMLLKGLGKLEEAEAPMREALAIFKKVLGEEHPNVATLLNNLAQLLSAQGNYGGAEELYNEALVIRLKVLGDDHPDTGTTYNDLGSLYKSKGDYTKAGDMLWKAVEVYKRKFGNEHPWVATGLNNLALLLGARGDYVQAEKLQREALRMDKKIHGDEHPDVARDLNSLAWLYKAQGRNQKAKELGIQAYEIARRVLGEEHPDTQNYKFYTTFTY